MDDSLHLLLQQILSGQTAIEGRLYAIETTMAEKRGERRMALWLVGALSSVSGAVLGNAFKLFGRHT